MRKETIYCDKCGKEKQESNNWICFVRSGFNTLTFHPWDDKINGHLCGRECAGRLLDEVLDANTAS